ncbi:MAG: hypothetical protein V7731_13375 [Amphritea sp.]
MTEFNLFVLARALHVIAVVFWIGGVAFVTTVLLAAVKQLVNKDERLQLFESLEGRFALQARITTLLTGLSGFYMLHYLDAWDRYLQLQFWWLHLMTLVWILFTLVLFILEPLFLHRWFQQQASRDSDGTFRKIHRMHRVLLTLSVVAVFGGVAGGHGLLL